MKRFRDYVLDDDGKPINGVTVTVRKSAPTGLNTRVPGQPGQSGTSAGGGAGGAAGGGAAQAGAVGGDWGAAGGSHTNPGGAGGHAVKLTNGASITWIAGNTAARVKGAVGA